MKRAAIITFNIRINIEGKNIRSLEAIYFRKILMEDLGYNEVDFVSRRTKKEDGIEYYKNISETDLNDYDEVYIHNSNDNYFGGVVHKEFIESIRKVNKFKGEVFYLITDPKLKFKNFANKIYSLDKSLSEDDVNKFTIKMLSFKALWTGRNYLLFTKHLKSDIILPWGFNIKLFEKIFKDKFENVKYEIPSFKDRPYDLCYYGNNRQGYRQKKIKNYLRGGSLKKYVIGFDPKIEGVEINWIKYVDNKELYKEVQKSRASITIGDLEHNNNIITARWFENIIYGVINFVDNDYDSDKLLYKDSLLRELLYVEDWFDIEIALERIDKENLYEEIIEKQKVEMFNQFK